MVILSQFAHNLLCLVLILTLTVIYALLVKILCLKVWLVLLFYFVLLSDKYIPVLKKVCINLIFLLSHLYFILLLYCFSDTFDGIIKPKHQRHLARRFPRKLLSSGESTVQTTHFGPFTYYVSLQGGRVGESLDSPIFSDFTTDY